MGTRYLDISISKGEKKVEYKSKNCVIFVFAASVYNWVLLNTNSIIVVSFDLFRGHQATYWLHDYFREEYCIRCHWRWSWSVIWEMWKSWERKIRLSSSSEAFQRVRIALNEFEFAKLAQEHSQTNKISKNWIFDLFFLFLLFRFAFVDFKMNSSVNAAIKMNGAEFKNRKLMIVKTS